jgi:hypothetical protein
LCEESLWEDFALMPALRDDFLGDELAGLGRKVLQPDGRTVRQIRDRLSPEVARLRKSDGVLTRSRRSIFPLEIPRHRLLQPRGDTWMRSHFGQPLVVAGGAQESGWRRRGIPDSARR